MVDTGTVLDQGMIYFDARLSRHHPTVEVRIAAPARTDQLTAYARALTRPY